MSTTKFTDYMIKNLKPKASKYYQREGHGFAICVYPSGVKSFFFIYTIDSRRYSMSLGSYPDLTLAKAREAHSDAWKLYNEGRNPALLQEETREERRQAPIVSDLIDEYLERHAKKFKRSWAEDERILGREVLPVWGKRKLEDIKKRDINLLLERIVDRGTPSMANNTFKIIRKMMNYAVEKDILPYSPAFGVKLPAPLVTRDRVLSQDEIKTLWNRIDSASMYDVTRKALKLVLVTAQRPGEVVGMHVSEIDGRWWTIPSDRSKNGKAHRVYLTDTALELIGDTTDGYVFPCPHKSKDKPIDRHALSRAVTRNLAWPISDDKGKPLYNADGQPVTENRLGVNCFTPHDLRRTAATFMAQQGFMDEVIDAVLNHSKQGVIKVYNLYRYCNEKQQALESWEQMLNSIL